MTLAIAVAAVAVVAIASYVAYGLWRSAKLREAYAASFSSLDDGVIGAVYKVAGAHQSKEALQHAVRDAVGILCAASVWKSSFVVDALSGLRIAVHGTTSWTDAYGRKIAGCAVLELNVIEVGCDLAALCHELVEVLVVKLPGAVLNLNENAWLEDKRLSAAMVEYGTSAGRLEAVWECAVTSLKAL